jgi:Rrf2 family protein
MLAAGWVCRGGEFYLESLIPIRLISLRTRNTTLLTKTTETGIQALVYLAHDKIGAPISPRTIAAALNVSPTYLAKIVAALVKANILRAHKGVKGGVTFARAIKTIRLLDVVQALQGVVLGRYCEEPKARVPVCAFHDAMQELYTATVTVLGKWTLQDLANRPYGEHSASRRSACLMECLKALDR